MRSAASLPQTGAASRRSSTSRRAAFAMESTWANNLRPLSTQLIYEPRAQSARGSPPRPSQRIEEIHQILLLLLRESDSEPLVVEIHRVQERRRGAVVKIGRARRQSAQ